jgi:hypothetical protein
MSLCLVTAVRNPQRETEWTTRLCELSREVFQSEDSGLPGRDAVSCPTFRKKIVPSSSWFKQS